MQMDFHYYATYCAAFLAGYSHEESIAIAYSAQYVDCCTRTRLKKINAPLNACTTQLQMEMMSQRTDIIGLQDITRIWASFHFLPYDLYADVKHGSKRYKNKYRLICKPNGALIKDTVELAKGSTLQAVGIAMHILADTWAHSYFAGTPSFVINNTDFHFYEVMPDDTTRRLDFVHKASTPDDVENGIYTNTVYQPEENTIMNLGHGRCGHLPDYSFARYKYLPAWAEYEEIFKDNPTEYYNAFCQMVYAMRYLRGDVDEFELNTYATDTVEPYSSQIKVIINKRQLIACDDWKAFGESLSHSTIEDFDIAKYDDEYVGATDKPSTFLGNFTTASLKHKSMVTNKIFKSKNPLAGYSVNGSKGIRDFVNVLNQQRSKSL